MTIEGDYKSILCTIIEEGMYDPFMSPVFSKDELITFYNRFDENKFGWSPTEIALHVFRKNGTHERKNVRAI